MQNTTPLSNVTCNQSELAEGRNKVDDEKCISYDTETMSSETVRPLLKTSITSEVNSSRQSTKLIVRTEKSAIVLALIVILFLFTHSYRMALKVYEVALPNLNTIDRFTICYTLQR